MYNSRLHFKNNVNKLLNTKKYIYTYVKTWFTLSEKSEMVREFEKCQGKLGKKLEKYQRSGEMLSIFYKPGKSVDVNRKRKALMFAEIKTYYKKWRIREPAKLTIFARKMQGKSSFCQG